jgi:hypothetical protein
MNLDLILSDFSRNRLDGEPVPDDVKALLRFHEELAERTEIEPNWTPGWAPWLDTSYLNDGARADPDIAANVRAIADVCGLIAFVATDDEEQYFGYWRGPEHRKVADSPLVFFDNEGQFTICASRTLAEAVLSRVYDDERFADLRDWFKAIGIKVGCETVSELTCPQDEYPPNKLHNELYYRYGKS